MSAPDSRSTREHADRNVTRAALIRRLFKRAGGSGANTSLSSCVYASAASIALRPFHRPGDNAMKGYVTVGLSMLAGAALLEVALVPGLVIGGAAVLLAPQLPTLRRHLRPLFNSTVSQRRESTGRPRRKRAAPLPVRFGVKAPLDPARFGIKQAIAKTITFRIIVTTLDFTTNYVVIGELATAAGLSAFALVAGPVFYLAHETAWNCFGLSGADLLVPIRLPLRLPPTGGA